MNFFRRIFSFTKKDKSAIKKGNSWSGKEQAVFIKNLKQVIQSAEKLSRDFDFNNGSYNRVFRKTNPVIDGYNLYHFEDEIASWKLDDRDRVNYVQLLEAAINTRDEEIDIDLTGLDELGSIVSFQTGITKHDGIPVVKSQGFVDESDVPPIDTWFYLKHNYYHEEGLCEQVLFCWIPKAFVDKMQSAIDVEVLGSYQWLKQNDNQFYRLITNDEETDDAILDGEAK